MIPPYEIFLRSEAIHALRMIRGTSRRQVSAFIDSLTTNPLLEGDYQVRDSSDREIQIKIIGPYAITFWSDHPAREIKIIDIRKADQA